jgi:hypothetical protein
MAMVKICENHHWTQVIHVETGHVLAMLND